MVMNLNRTASPIASLGLKTVVTLLSLSPCLSHADLLSAAKAEIRMESTCNGDKEQSMDILFSSPMLISIGISHGTGWQSPVTAYRYFGDGGNIELCPRGR